MVELIRIKREALHAIIKSAKSTHPLEFTALLEGRADLVKVIVMLPGDAYAKSFSSYDPYMLPLGIEVIGSVHSHPNGDFRPSRQDLRTFSKTGGVHSIIGHPYGIKSICFYNSRGEAVAFKVV